MKNIYVHSWNFHPKNVNGLKLLIQYLNLNIVNTIDEADIIYSADRPLDSTKYPYKKYIFGPQFSVFPENSFFSLDNKFKNTIYIHPAYWTIDTWYEFRANKSNVPILTAPFPVDIEKFSPKNSIKDKIFIYFKRRNPNELTFVKNYLKIQNINPILVTYGNYKEEDYIKLLRESKYGIWIGTHESQGFALEEALSSNVPLLVWNVTRMSQEHGSNYSHVKSVANTIDYWDERCGEFFYTEEELDSKFNLFISKLNQYKPREYILENLDVKNCYEKFWKKIL